MNEPSRWKRLLRRHGVRLVVYSLLVAGLMLSWRGRHRIVRLYQTGEWRSRSVRDVLKTHEPRVRARLEPRLAASGLSWPPEELVLVAIKESKQLEMWTVDDDERPLLLASYPIKGASGELGPKRRRGDLQVPEGLYGLPVLNPNSQFHLSIRVDYPSDDDRRVLVAPDLGDDIYVHGKSASIGCLAIGDEAIEEVFVVAANVSARKRRIVISPVDFRSQPDWKPSQPVEPWLAERYALIKKELMRFGAPVE